MIYPRPKQIILGERHPLITPLSVFCADAPGRRALFALGEMAPYLEISEIEQADGATLSLSLVPGLFPNKEEYELTVQNGKACVRAKDFRGMINALATLVQLLSYEGDLAMLPDATVRDFPDTAFRSFMADPARNRIPMDEMRALILSMAKAKLNKLHLHLSDSTGFCYETRTPLPASPGGKYSKAELSELIRYAGAFGIDVIPEIDFPGHSNALTELRPELKCRVEGKNVSGWNVCLGNEDSYALIDDLLAELAEIFPYEYIHVGTDEIHMEDLVELDPYPISHSEECECCRAFFAPLGLHTLRERFYWFVKRIYATVTSLGKRMIIWNDDIDISKSPDLPRDILIEFWRVAAEGRGPVEGCSMQRFLEEGFEVINADFPNTYVDEYVEWDRLKKWNPLADPADASACPHAVPGGEMCAWEGSNYPHYLYALYFAMPAFADRLWSISPLPDGEEATLALTRASLGADTPDGEDFFRFTRDVPLGSCRLWEGSIFRDEYAARATAKLLRTLTHQSADERHLKEALLRYVENNHPTT